MNTPPDTATDVPLHRRVHLAGYWVLGLGLLSAVLIYLYAYAHPDTQNLPDFSADRRFNYNLERLGGKAAVYMAALNRWLGSLWQGTTLAFTVATLSVVIALLCFWLANLLSYPPLDAAPPAPPKSD